MDSQQVGEENSPIPREEISPCPKRYSQEEITSTSYGVFFFTYA